MKWKAYPVYLYMEGAVALIMSMIFTASGVYQVTIAHLTPLQLVLVGTMLEASVFLFEVPTGVVADVYSRRLSILIGVALIGAGFILEGTFPIFWVILLAQVVWGVGYTFTSGATQAWITDEIGEEAAGQAFLRSNQIGQVSALAGIGAGILIGNQRVNLPIQIGGLALIVLAGSLAWVMPETGFAPAPRQGRTPWQNMLHTFRQGLGMVKRRPALLTILTIGLVYGLYSEGFDRLWTKHILDNFLLPLKSPIQPVVWIGLVRAAGMLLSVGAVEAARRKIRTDSPSEVSRGLYFLSLILVASLFSFALAGSLTIALIAYVLVDVSREVISPLYTAWVNQRLDSSVRATVLSMSGQIDAIGQVIGGPVIGSIGSLVSVRAALAASGLILSPILLLYPAAIRHPEALAVQENGLNSETMNQEN
jgi:DHA3 family tetracycline resistance protein-like MFS transporter